LFYNIKYKTVVLVLQSGAPAGYKKWWGTKKIWRGAPIFFTVPPHFLVCAQKVVGHSKKSGEAQSKKRNGGAQ